MLAVLASAALSSRPRARVAADTGDDIVVQPEVAPHRHQARGRSPDKPEPWRTTERWRSSFSLEFIETPGEDWQVGIRGALTNYPVVRRLAGAVGRAFHAVGVQDP